MIRNANQRQAAKRKIGESDEADTGVDILAKGKVWNGNDL